MKYYKLLLYGIVLLTIIFFTSSCKHTNKQNNMLDALEKNGIEVPSELREEAGFSWADIVFPLTIVVSLGLIVFFAFRRFKNKADEIGYSLGDLVHKTESFTKDKEIFNKMSNEEKKGLEDIQKFFENKKE